MAPRLLILDFDGTLADSFPWFLGALQDTAQRFGFRCPPRDEAEALRARGSRAILSALGVPLWRLPAIAAHLRQLAIDAPAPPLFDGIPEILESLAAAGLRLAIASSNTEAQIRRTLGPKLAGHISAHACNATLFGKAARFRRILKATALPPAAAMAIGDELRDIEAAREAGIAAGAVAWGYADAATLREARPDAFFGQPADLLRLRPG